MCLLAHMGRDLGLGTRMDDFHSELFSHLQELRDLLVAEAGLLGHRRHTAFAAEEGCTLRHGGRANTQISHGG